MFHFFYFLFGLEECEVCCESSVNGDGRCIGELLIPQYALTTGGLARDHRPIITFPDHSNFHTLASQEYHRLLLYLTSVPSLLDTEMGFHIIIDRRRDRWNSVKTVLLRLSEYFPSIIHAVYVLRPAGFLQKALSEVSSKLFKEDFKFKVIVCSTIDELYEYIDKTQLTPDFGGDLEYSHTEWIQERFALEKFSNLMREISNKLDSFMQEITDCDLGNSPEQTKELLNKQENQYEELKDEISVATVQGEQLLDEIRKPNSTHNTISHVAALERLIVQLEETEKQFDSFWHKHSTKLNHWLKFRTFLLNFKEMQLELLDTNGEFVVEANTLSSKEAAICRDVFYASLDKHLKAACDMTEVGETASHVINLIAQANDFEKQCKLDIDRSNHIIQAGEHLMLDPLTSVDSIESKCEELKRTQSLLIEKIEKRNNVLCKAKELMNKIEMANAWCASGVELLSRDSTLVDVEALISEAEHFGLSKPETFREDLLKQSTPETKALVTQVCQRVVDVWIMVEVRKQKTSKPMRPVLHVPPHIHFLLPVLLTSAAVEMIEAVQVYFEYPPMESRRL